MTRICLITGDPAVGKTTVLSRLILKAKTEGYTVGGILTREIRSHGERIGFNLVDPSTEESALLAGTEVRSGPRIGKYRINLKTLSTIAVRALERANAKCDLIVCDEVGPMELYSPEFRKAVEGSILSSEKPCVCLIHKRMEDPLIEKLRTNPQASEYEVTYENRSSLPDEIWKEISSQLKEISAAQSSSEVG